MGKYKYLLWDVDGTILDFAAAEKAAVKSLFINYGFGECTDEMIERYHHINIKYWQALERGEMTKPQILVGRYREFFELEGLDASRAEAFNDDYQLALGDTVVFCDDAYTLLGQLKGKYVLCAVTNGTAVAQEKKLRTSGLDKIFDYTFISDKIGIEKPNTGFFDVALAQAGIKDRSEALVIGDSLTSDILGANNAGLDCCWYNPKHKSKDRDVSINYEIDNLWQIKNII